MTTMLEKAARAACEALSPVTGRPMLGFDPDFNDRPNIEAGRDGDELLECEVIALVRAVLMAVRDPDEGMLVNGREAILPIAYQANAPVPLQAVSGAWRDMIDHILSEGEG